MSASGEGEIRAFATVVAEASAVVWKASAILGVTPRVLAGPTAVMVGSDHGRPEE